MGAILRTLEDGAWHNGAELIREGGGNRYTARVGRLRELGYEIEARTTTDGDFDDYRLLGLSDPRYSTTVFVKLSFATLEKFFERRFTNDIRDALIDAYARAKIKRDEAIDHQHRRRQADALMSSFFDTLSEIHEDQTEY